MYSLSTIIIIQNTKLDNAKKNEKTKMENANSKEVKLRHHLKEEAIEKQKRKKYRNPKWFHSLLLECFPSKFSYLYGHFYIIQKMYIQVL